MGHADCEAQDGVARRPGQRLLWGALRAGQHDDFLISAAFVTWLDQADWSPGADSEILPPCDPLSQVDSGPF